ncbi:MAG: hypothetical protein LBD37_09550 [Treponema sp.]|jgi:hypothetical protein|nr:hypothetical protein [Treponema sp.]
MPFQELRELIVQVVSSWQVIAVTLVVILYFSLVSYVTKVHYRPHTSAAPKGKRRKAKKAAPESDVISADSDDLGLEGE